MQIWMSICKDYYKILKYVDEDFMNFAENIIIARSYEDSHCFISWMNLSGNENLDDRSCKN